MEEEKKCQKCPRRRVEARLHALEENVRLMMSRQFQCNAMMKRNQAKIMEGFRCIEQAFKLNCNKQIEMNEQLADFSSDMGGTGFPGDAIFKV